jgi:phosphatidylinositol glycan class T
MSVDYDYVLVSFEDFPADPNRGMEMPPSIATFYCAPEFHTTLFTPLARLYSHPLLIMPPVPDMSMPFNILSLTSTLYAFCIGGLVNLLVRKSSERIKRQYESATQASTKKSLRDRVRHMVRQSKLGKLIWRTPTETTEPKNPSSESMVANS